MSAFERTLKSAWFLLSRYPPDGGETIMFRPFQSFSVAVYGQADQRMGSTSSMVFPISILYTAVKCTVIELAARDIDTDRRTE